MNCKKCMLASGFEAYYMAGVRLSWNIGNFYTKKNKRREIQTSIRNIEAQRETFLFNTDLDITQKESSIDTYFDQLRYDDEIIELRVAVKQASEAKMANGTLSGSDLVRDINAEQMARQDKIMREMELHKWKVPSMFTMTRCGWCVNCWNPIILLVNSAIWKRQST